MKLDWKKSAILLGAVTAFLLSLGLPIDVYKQLVLLSATLTAWVSPATVAESSFLAPWTTDTMVAVAGVGIMLNVGFILGAWLSKLNSGETEKATTKNLPESWKAAKGDDMGTRYTWAFIGGILMLVGAALAGGSLLGHTLTGTTQLSVASVLFIISMFAFGRPVAKKLYEGAK